MPTRLPSSEYDRRLVTVRERLAEAQADAAVWFGATSIAYLTGFHHVQTERPICLAVTADRVTVTVPRLEVERATRVEAVDEVYHYFDYPGGEPIATAAGMLRDLGVEAVIADGDGAPGTMGYEGPALSEFIQVALQDWVTELRQVKSDDEVDLIRESVRWGHLAHRYLADRIGEGAHPATVSQRASLEASRAMLDALGDEYVPRTRGTGPVRAGFISGAQTALPHGHTANRRLETGDVIVTGSTATVDGYVSELERTMFLGEPDDDDRHYFELMCQAQRLAIDTLGPDVPVAEVDRVVWEYFDEQNVTDLARHHVGHNIGLEGHEPPYIDRGSDATMEPGHVYTIEPGLYTDTAGYRHSDTVVITETGAERLTYFPRDLQSNVIRT